MDILRKYERCQVYYIETLKSWRLYAGGEVIGRLEGYRTMGGAKIAALKLGYKVA